MQGLMSHAGGAVAACSLRSDAAWALVGLLLSAALALALALPPSARAQEDYGPFECSADAADVEAMLERHLAERHPMLEHVYAARVARREAWRALRAAQRGEVPATMEQGLALEAQHTAAVGALQVMEGLRRSWLLCRAELQRRRRYYPRAVHHLRLSLGFDGALWSMRNQDYAAEDDYTRVWYRTPGVALRVGWERFYLKRLGVQVNGTLAAGQGRLRACAVSALPDCYGHPPAGGALSVAVDVGLRVWVAPAVVLGVAAELRVARLPTTARTQHGYTYSVSDRLVPALLARLGPEILLSPDGRWWVSPTFGFGRPLTQRGSVYVAALRVGYVL